MKRTIIIAFYLQACMLNAQHSTSISLDGEWQLCYGLHDRNTPVAPDELKNREWPVITGRVPGNVELDLLSAGEIEDPEKGSNVYDLRKYEAYQWWYYRTFETPGHAEGERIQLVFEGLDCFGTIWINHQPAGKTDNMLIGHRFDITDLLEPEGENTIHVRIDPAVPESQKYITPAVGVRWDLWVEQLHVRKAPHMYGWDIMPRLVSAGLWRGVRLDIRKPTRIEQAYWMTNEVDLPGRKAQIVLDWQIATDYPTIDGLTMEASLKRGSTTLYEGSFPLFSHSSRRNISLKDVDFWWPRGYGDPVLYDATMSIVDEQGNILDQQKQKIGIRTAELIRTEITSPEDPGEFVFRINGEKIFIRGTNWVPLDALHSRDRDHLEAVFQMVTDLNCNMIRCWGGNVYEDHPFFDLCDENGVMVWQDFAMGCTVYPLDQSFREKIREEAIQIVLKLRKHASLVLWCGNNEDDSAMKWARIQRIDPGLDAISREVLPRVIWEYDPLRPYLPSSPYYSAESVRRGDGNLLPERHLWGPRGYHKDPFYTDVNAHFVSEIGYHGCPNRSSLERMFNPDRVYPWTPDGQWNDEWQAKAVIPHPDAPYTVSRNDLMTKQIRIIFGDCPTDLDRFIFASQAVQAEVMKFFIEFWRMDKFRRTGIIWWNLRDGWPIISDAIVDFYNSRKLAYYYIRQVQHNACVMIGDPKEENHPVIAVNDTREAKSGTVTVRDADSGVTLFEATFRIPANGKTLVGNIPEMHKQAMWLIDYTIGEGTYKNHYLAGEVPFNLDDYERWYRKLGIDRY
jgi:beta-mannosidase